MATLLQPRRLAEHSLLERLVGFSSGLKFYMERTALHVILPVCSPASDGPTSGVFRKTDLRQNDTFSQISPTYVWTLPLPASQDIFVCFALILTQTLLSL